MLPLQLTRSTKITKSEIKLNLNSTRVVKSTDF